MIVKDFKIKDLNLKYFVGINQIKINLNSIIGFNRKDNEEEVLNQLFERIKEIQDKYQNSVVQFFKDKFILNEDHIFTACYYLQKAFIKNKNISNKKNIELFIYLAANRQINKSIEGFGIDISDLRKNKLNYCIISPQNILNDIYLNISSAFSAEEEVLTLNNQSTNKIKLIKTYFEITDNQINCILKSYGINPNNSDLNLKYVVSALYDLICEKMALLYAEGA
ncbi:MAG: KEOPS complex subunit Cgi121 [Candidatus Odinarchaeota archaeon]